MSSPCSSSHHSVSEPSLPSPMYRQLSQLISLILHSSPTTKCHTSHTVFFHQSCYPWSQDSSFFSFSLHSLLHILFWSLTFSFYFHSQLSPKVLLPMFTFPITPTRSRPILAFPHSAFIPLSCPLHPWSPRAVCVNHFWNHEITVFFCPCQWEHHIKEHG